MDANPDAGKPTSLTTPIHEPKPITLVTPIADQHEFREGFDPALEEFARGLVEGFEAYDGLRITSFTKDGGVLKFKVPIPGINGKEGAKDAPSWARGERPYVGESGKDFADRLLGDQYGKGQYDTGPRTEHSRIKKWADRSFTDPK